MKLKDLKVGDIILFEVEDDYTTDKLTIITYFKYIFNDRYGFQDLWVSDGAELDEDWELTQDTLDNGNMKLIKILDHLDTPVNYLKRKMPELFV
jgi:hypothetical protein